MPIGAPNVASPKASKASSAPGASSRSRSAVRPDWPNVSQGEDVDLKIHDLPHDSSSLEWWYHNVHIETTCGRSISLFSSFFRIVSGADASSRTGCEYSHALTSALIDADKKKHFANVILDKNAPELLKKKIEKDVTRDKRISNAFLEVLNKGKVPLPDKLVQNDIKCSTSALDIAIDDNTLVKVGYLSAHLTALLGVALLLALALAGPWANLASNASLTSLVGKLPAGFSSVALQQFPGQGKTEAAVRGVLVALAVVAATMHALRMAMAPAVSYRLQLSFEGGSYADLLLVPRKKPQLHGTEGTPGIVHTGDDSDMFYYFIPSCSVTGTLVVEGESLSIKTAKGWYDHEFGGKPLAKKKEAIANETEKITEQDNNYGWSWVALQLDDIDVQITAAVITDMRAAEPIDKAAIVVEADGSSQRYGAEKDGMDLVGSELWRSTRSFAAFPQRWKLTVPGVLDLTLTATFPDQEVMTMLVGAFWEGRLELEGTYKGKRVTGKGFCERKGHGDMKDLKSFFTSVGEKVRETVRMILPTNDPDVPGDTEAGKARGSYEDYLRLVANKDNEHLMEGLSTDVYAEVVLGPIRDVTDRGGKSWRAYGALACCDAVGGDSRKYVHLICLPELMHSGSLIIDDIQDKSEMRRGKKCVHLIYGDALAINAGSACYFLGQELLNQVDCSTDTKLRMYETWILALRAGHAGQGLDIKGSDHLMDEAVATGDGAKVEASVHCIHRLKTAFPARCLAQMGAIYGGGTEEQILAIGQFFEATGLAFQIIDDVLNLRGLIAPGGAQNAGVGIGVKVGKGASKASDGKTSQALKVVGEDIMEGKVTAPIAKAMILFKTKAERQHIWDTVKGCGIASNNGDTQAKHQDKIDECIAKLEAVGAIQACADQANDMVDAAWDNLDRCLPDSFYKVVLRSFSWYLIQRHY